MYFYLSPDATNFIVDHAYKLVETGKESFTDRLQRFGAAHCNDLTDPRGEGPAYAIFNSRDEAGYEEAPALGWVRASPFFFLWFLYKGVPENPLPSQSLEADIPEKHDALLVPVGEDWVALNTTAVGFEAAEQPDTPAWLRLRYHYLVHAIGLKHESDRAALRNLNANDFGTWPKLLAVCYNFTSKESVKMRRQFAQLVNMRFLEHAFRSKQLPDYFDSDYASVSTADLLVDEGGVAGLGSGEIKLPVHSDSEDEGEDEEGVGGGVGGGEEGAQGAATEVFDGEAPGGGEGEGEGEEAAEVQSMPVPVQGAAPAAEADIAEAVAPQAGPGVEQEDADEEEEQDLRAAMGSPGEAAPQVQVAAATPAAGTGLFRNNKKSAAAAKKPSPIEASDPFAFPATCLPDAEAAGSDAGRSGPSSPAPVARRLPMPEEAQTAAAAQGDIPSSQANAAAAGPRRPPSPSPAPVAAAAAAAPQHPRPTEDDILQRAHELGTTKGMLAILHDAIGDNTQLALDEIVRIAGGEEGGRSEPEGEDEPEQAPAPRRAALPAATQRGQEAVAVLQFMGMMPAPVEDAPKKTAKKTAAAAEKKKAEAAPKKASKGGRGAKGRGAAVAAEEEEEEARVGAAPTPLPAPQAKEPARRGRAARGNAAAAAAVPEPLEAPALEVPASPVQVPPAEPGPSAAPAAAPKKATGGKGKGRAVKALAVPEPAPSPLADAPMDVDDEVIPEAAAPAPPSPAPMKAGKRSAAPRAQKRGRAASASEEEEVAAEEGGEEERPAEPKRGRTVAAKAKPAPAAARPAKGRAPARDPEPEPLVEEEEVPVVAPAGRGAGKGGKQKRAREPEEPELAPQEAGQVEEEELPLPAAPRAPAKKAKGKAAAEPRPRAVAAEAPPPAPQEAEEDEQPAAGAAAAAEARRSQRARVALPAAAPAAAAAAAGDAAFVPPDVFREGSVVLQLSGMHTDEQERAKAALARVKRTGCTVSVMDDDPKNHKYDPKATHLLVGPKFLRGQRVLSFFAAGKWVVGVDFLLVDRLKRGAETARECLQGTEKIAPGAARHWRRRRAATGQGAFHGLAVVLDPELRAPDVIDADGKPKNGDSMMEELRAILKAGGAKVVDTLPDTCLVPEAADVVVVSTVINDHGQLVPRVNPQLTRKQAMVSWEWVYDFLSKPTASLESHYIGHHRPQGHRAGSEANVRMMERVRSSFEIYTLAPKTEAAKES